VAVALALLTSHSLELVEAAIASVGLGSYWADMHSWTHPLLARPNLMQSWARRCASSSTGKASCHGVAAGLALGAVWYPGWAPPALQLGGHVEGRYELGSRRERALPWAGQFDSSAVVLVPVEMFMLLTSDWNFGT
jgi:hypothetical protein